MVKSYFLEFFIVVLMFQIFYEKEIFGKYVPTMGLALEIVRKVQIGNTLISFIL